MEVDDELLYVLVGNYIYEKNNMEFALNASYEGMFYAKGKLEGYLLALDLNYDINFETGRAVVFHNESNIAVFENVYQ